MIPAPQAACNAVSALVVSVIEFVQSASGSEYGLNILTPIIVMSCATRSPVADIAAIFALEARPPIASGFGIAESTAVDELAFTVKVGADLIATGAAHDESPAGRASISTRRRS